MRTVDSIQGQVKLRVCCRRYYWSSIHASSSLSPSAKLGVAVGSRGTSGTDAREILGAAGIPRRSRHFKPGLWFGFSALRLLTRRSHKLVHLFAFIHVLQLKMSESNEQALNDTIRQTTAFHNTVSLSNIQTMHVPIIKG